MNLTDGAHYIYKHGGAWVVDAIASYQTRQLLSDPSWQKIQFWKLRVNPDQTAQLICERDTNDVVLTQEIEFIDFPLDEIKLYLTQEVLMLPSEY